MQELVNKLFIVGNVCLVGIFFLLRYEKQKNFNFSKFYVLDVYGLLVHNCYVEDGQGEKQIILDENGYNIL